MAWHRNADNGRQRSNQLVAAPQPVAERLLCIIGARLSIVSRAAWSGGHLGFHGVFDRELRRRVPGIPKDGPGVVDLMLPTCDLRATANALKVVPVAGEKPIGIDEAIDFLQKPISGHRAWFRILADTPRSALSHWPLALRSDRRAPAITVFVDPWAHRGIEAFDPRQFSAANEYWRGSTACMPGRGSAGCGKSWCFSADYCHCCFRSVVSQCAG
jgi:hypothetical protein